MSFDKQSSYHNHNLTHQINKNKCKHCDKNFARSGDLAKHMMIHTGQKNFKCTVCNKQFTQNGNLKVHMRIHTGEKPYQCSYCSKTFYTNQHCKTHVIGSLHDQVIYQSICLYVQE